MILADGGITHYAKAWAMCYHTSAAAPTRLFPFIHLKLTFFRPIWYYWSAVVMADICLLKFYLGFNNHRGPFS